MHKKLLTIGVGAAVVGGIAMAAPASAAQSVQSLQCGGATLLLRTNDNNSSDHGGWSVAKVVQGGTGHLIPVSFTFSAYDLTTQQLIFEGTQPKGGGNANHQQSTITCTQSQAGALGDLLEPGEQPPPGTSVTDQVELTFTVEAVARP